jgi:regulatory protein
MPGVDIQADPLAEIESSAMRMLAAREHSRFELARKLRQRGHLQADIDSVLDDLQARNLLSDARFAEAYLEQRLRKGYGPLRVRAELSERGVDNALVDHALECLSPDWPELLAETAARKFGASRPSDFSDARRRGRFLQQRGFPAAMIRRYLGEDSFA